MAGDAFDVVVIGSGSAGLAAAYGIADGTRTVAIVERDRYLGGECPNYACVPTKALLRAARIASLISHADQFGLDATLRPPDFSRIWSYKESVVVQTAGRQLSRDKLHERGITLLQGNAQFVDAHTLSVGTQRISGRQFVLSTGSRPLIPAIDGLETTPYLTSRTAVDLKTLPDSILILGGGAVGVEFAQLFAAFGSDVTLIERADRILPNEEPETSETLTQLLKGFGVVIHTGFTAERVSGDTASVSLEGTQQGKTNRLMSEQLLIAAGSQPNTDTLGLDLLGVAFNNKQLVLDEYLRTSAPYIWAAGDAIGHTMYTHTAHYEGALVAHNMTQTQKRSLDLRIVPRCVFTFTEVASVGVLEQDLQKEGRAYVVGSAPIATLGRALTDQEPAGFVKVLADQQTGQILGATVVAERAGEMIHELVLAMKGKVPVSTVAETIHAYPTYSEAIMIAAAHAREQLI